MKKIIFCIPELVIGGAETALCELLFALHKKNIYKLSVITFKPIQHEKYKTFFQENNITLYDASLKRKTIKFIDRFFQKRSIYKIFQDQDIIIDFKYTQSAKYYKKINKPKLCWLHCGFNYLTKYVNIEELIPYDKIICVSHSIVNDIQKELPQIKNKTVTLYNPINLEQIEKQALLSYYPTKQPYFVAVQRLDKAQKDVETIIKAFNLFSQANPYIYIYIVGDGDKEYKKYLQQLCKTPQIIFTGELNNSYAIIKNALALILSSTKEVGEGLPVVLQEAQALQTVAISSDVKSGPQEILLAGKAGFLFEQGNYQELAKLLETVIQTPSLCQEKINNANQNLSRFFPNTVTQDFINIINSL